MNVTLRQGHLGRITLGNGDYSQAGDFADFMPLGQGLGLIIPHQQKQLGTWVFKRQFAQSIDRVSGPGALNFPWVYLGMRDIGKSQPRHGQAVRRIGQGSVFVPSLARRQDVQSIQL
jgi:hypothetical protein